MFALRRRLGRGSQHDLPEYLHDVTSSHASLIIARRSTTIARESEDAMSPRRLGPRHELADAADASSPPLANNSRVRKHATTSPQMRRVQRPLRAYLQSG